MGFLNPTFVLALAGAGLPLAIHLLTRDRVRRVQFSTLRFFVRSSRSILRRRRVREMVLLAMRMAACGMLAVAFARPIFGSRPDLDGDGTITAATARVVVVDLSASMARAGMADEMRAKALSALEGLSPAVDAAGLVTFSDTPNVLIPLTARLGDVMSAVPCLGVGHGGTDIAEALRRANELLRSADARRKEVVLVSDLQRAGWKGFSGDWRMAPGVGLSVLEVAPSGGLDDVAIVDASYPRSMVKDNSPRTIAARVANYSAEERRCVEVRLDVAGERVAVQALNISPGATAPVRFRHVFERDGDNTGAVTVVSKDAVAGNNVFAFNARVIPRIKVLVLNGRPSPRPLADAAFFVKAALAPTEESPFVARSVEATRATPADVAGASVAVLADVRSVTSAVREALGDLLSRGGGLLFMPGESCEAGVFNSVFGRLAPCRLRRVISPDGGPGRAATAALTKVNFDHPVFQAFLLPHHGDLGVARFARYWEVSDSQLARVHARFDDGRPAVLEREIGGGVSMMVVSPAELGWNDLPRRAVFLPFVHQTARYLAVRTEQETGHVVGEAIPVPEGARVMGPYGDEEIVGDRVIAEAPGIYTVVGADGRPVIRHVVNRAFSEADPATMSADELVGALVEPGDGAAADAAGGDDLPRRGATDEHHVWWYVMAALALVTVGELYVANGTQRH
ncbi:MAG: BatA domain-containing protein [Planctomycetota bacterium]|jgi:hypothetical protein